MKALKKSEILLGIALLVLATLSIALIVTLKTQRSDKQVETTQPTAGETMSQ